jgi:hypothetical protein
MIPKPSEIENLDLRRSNMKKLLATLVVLTAIGSPAFAQYAPQDYQGAVSANGQHKNSVHQNGRNAFAMVPRTAAPSGLDDPTLTGGGSVGYNQLNRSY